MDAVVRRNFCHIAHLGFGKIIDEMDFDLKNTLIGNKFEGTNEVKAKSILQFLEITVGFPQLEVLCCWP